MTVNWTREMLAPIPSLVPMNAGQFLFDDSEWRDSWGVTRRLPFNEIHPHRVAEGYTDPDN